MPTGDKTGPNGQGPKTGRQMGNCEGAEPIQGRGMGQGAGFRRSFGRGMGRGAGFRRGIGQGRNFGACRFYGYSKEEEIKELKARLKELEE